MRKDKVMNQTPRQDLLRSMYEAFNARDVDSCLAAMTPDVDWANGWEGGRVIGRDAVRDYWQRQWAAIDSTAEPTAFTSAPTARSRSRITSSLRPGREGAIDGEGRHVYEFRGDLVERMTIEE